MANDVGKSSLSNPRDSLDMSASFRVSYNSKFMTNVTTTNVTISFKLYNYKKSNALAAVSCSAVSFQPKEMKTDDAIPVILKIKHLGRQKRF